MGPGETAITIPGGARVIGVFDRDGYYQTQIKCFLWVQIGSRTPFGIGLGSGSRLDRIRWRYGQSMSASARGACAGLPSTRLAPRAVVDHDLGRNYASHIRGDLRLIVDAFKGSIGSGPTS